MDESATPSGEPERWLPVVEYEGFYEVSDLGRVRSVPHKTASSNGHGMCYGKILKLIPGPDESPYLRAHLCREGVRRKRAVHILVAEAFLGPRPEGMQVCHGPGGSSDNRLTNLSYQTPSRNNGADRWRDGTMPAGGRCSKAKLTDEIVRECRARAAAGESYAALAREFGVRAKTVRKLVVGITWKNVPFPDVTEPPAA